MQINGNDCAKPSIIHANVSGIDATKIILRRPNLSQTGPLNTAPIGCVMYAHVASMISTNFSILIWSFFFLRNVVIENSPNHDVWAAVICTVSSGFKSPLIPSNDGITIDGNAANSPKLKIMKFFALAAKIYLIWMKWNDAILANLFEQFRIYFWRNGHLPEVKYAETSQSRGCRDFFPCFVHGTTKPSDLKYAFCHVLSELLNRCNRINFDIFYNSNLNWQYLCSVFTVGLIFYRQKKL